MLLALGLPGVMLCLWGCDPSQTTKSEAWVLLKSSSATHPLSGITTMMVACMGQGEMLKSHPPGPVNVSSLRTRKSL